MKLTANFSDNDTPLDTNLSLEANNMLLGLDLLKYDKLVSLFNDEFRHEETNHMIE